MPLRVCATDAPSIRYALRGRMRRVRRASLRPYGHARRKRRMLLDEERAARASLHAPERRPSDGDRRSMPRGAARHLQHPRLQTTKNSVFLLLFFESE